ncbi:Nn.00g019670.m01.CDS01 [Neocucurbitaria sp. VM-36]
MSRATIEQSLTGLVPTLNGPLPPELVELALSLLTRSRSVAQSMKPDEEIARPYACAQLACERLKQRLNLPTISSRPPCPPRIYKKLYGYLSSALPAPKATREPETPRKATASAPASAQNTPRPALSGRKTPRSGMKSNGKAVEAPEWIMPTIRALVKAFDYPSAAPHIYTGVESIYPLLARMSAADPETPSKRPRRAMTSQVSSAGVAEFRILSLIIVTFLYVFTRMKDEDVTPEQYNDWRETAVNTLLKLPQGKSTTYEELSLETEQMMPMAQEEGWLQMEWFLNIAPQDHGGEMEGIEMTGSTTRLVSGKSRGLRAGGSDYIGLGTMVQDATDYLGERQRDDYKKWKARVMVRVQELEAV